MAGDHLGAPSTTTGAGPERGPRALAAFSVGSEADDVEFLLVAALLVGGVVVFRRNRSYWEARTEWSVVTFVAGWLMLALGVGFWLFRMWLNDPDGAPDAVIVIGLGVLLLVAPKAPRVAGAILGGVAVVWLMTLWLWSNAGYGNGFAQIATELESQGWDVVIPAVLTAVVLFTSGSRGETRPSLARSIKHPVEGWNPVPGEPESLVWWDGARFTQRAVRAGDGWEMTEREVDASPSPPHRSILPKAVAGLAIVIFAGLLVVGVLVLVLLSKAFEGL